MVDLQTAMAAAATERKKRDGAAGEVETMEELGEVVQIWGLSHLIL